MHTLLSTDDLEELLRLARLIRADINSSLNEPDMADWLLKETKVCAGRLVNRLEELEQKLENGQ